MSEVLYIRDANDVESRCFSCRWEISHYVLPVRPWMRLWNVRVCRSLHTGPAYISCAYDAPLVRAHMYTRADDARVRFPCRSVVWVEGTHGRRKQRIMVITVIKRRPLRTRPGSTWKIRYFTFECGGTIYREPPRRRATADAGKRSSDASSPTL